MKSFLPLVHVVLLALVCTVCCSFHSDCLADDQIAAAHGDFFHLLLPDRDDFEFQYMYVPDQSEDGGPGKYDLNSFSLHGEVPLAVSQDSFFRLGGTYSARDYDFRRVPASPADQSSDTLQRAELLE